MVDFAKLCAPFPPEVVSWRVGSTNADKTRGLALAYIDARDVMRRLDEVCGPENWQRRYPWSDGKRLPCEIGIRVNGEWIWKSDGAGETDVEAEKGAFSDSFKRAAVSWGIGRYLYDLESPWVALEPMGRSYKIAGSEYPRLRALLAKSAPTKAVADAKPEPAPGEPPEKAQARDMYAAIVAGIKAATHPGDSALGLKIAGTGLDREDVAFIRRWAGDGPADRLHTLAATKIAELSRRNAA